MPAPKRTRYDASAPETIRALIETVSRQSAMLDRLAGMLEQLLGRRESVGDSGPPPVENTAPAGEPEVDPGLTRREVEIGRKLLAGMQRKEIAHDMGLSSWTIKSHQDKLYRKLGIHSKNDLKHHRKHFEEP